MGKGSSSPPPAPDPYQTANAQAGMNRETAITQAGLNSTNQITPYGNLTYSQIGTWDDGTPRYQAETSFSPEQQALYRSSTALQHSLGNIGNNLAGRVSDTLSNPFQLGNEATEARLMELGRSRLDPMFAQQRESLDANLAARGITPGSEAYNREINRFQQGQNDAYNSLLLSGRSQANNELLAERNQPLTELMSLLGGSQPTSPTFAQTPQTGVANTDLSGLVQQNYQNQMSAYNQQQQQRGSMFGNLLGTAGTIGGWRFSDKRVKEDIEKVGKLDNGLNIYRYRYKDGMPGAGLMQLGVMAQEVEKRNPDAVAEFNGIKAVDYAAATE